MMRWCSWPPLVLKKYKVSSLEGCNLVWEGIERAGVRW